MMLCNVERNTRRSKYRGLIKISGEILGDLEGPSLHIDFDNMDKKDKEFYMEAEYPDKFIGYIILIKDFEAREEISSKIGKIKDIITSEFEKMGARRI